MFGFGWARMRKCWSANGKHIRSKATSRNSDLGCLRRCEISEKSFSLLVSAWSLQEWTRSLRTFQSLIRFVSCCSPYISCTRAMFKSEIVICSFGISKLLIHNFNFGYLAFSGKPEWTMFWRSCCLCCPSVGHLFFPYYGFFTGRPPTIMEKITV